MGWFVETVVFHLSPEFWKCVCDEALGLFKFLQHSHEEMVSHCPGQFADGGDSLRKLLSNLAEFGSAHVMKRFACSTFCGAAMKKQFPVVSD
jgi:hypothetical protein